MQAAEEGAAEWVALLSRSTLDAAPRLLLRRRRAPPLVLLSQKLEAGSLVEVRGEGWVPDI